ncbi:DUF3578 domain-containing protein [Streptomyces sp. NPDC002238]|uniref:MrcB family domain-containing protein n=1 Tax=Streptomyces sp. NPDC002238 TaxID=3156649 RepID=UPI0033311A78
MGLARRPSSHGHASTRRAEPRAINGYYIVYPFSGDGGRVYLSLNQSTTGWSGGEFKAREPADLKRRVTGPVLASSKLPTSEPTC